MEELKEFVDVLQVKQKLVKLTFLLTYVGGGQEDHHNWTRSWRSLGLVKHFYHLSTFADFKT